MTEANYLLKESWNVECDRCGQKNKRTNCDKEWTGLLVCKRCWEPKHPWLLPVPVVIDGLPVPDARPRPKSTYIVPTKWTLSIWGVQYQRLNGTLASTITFGNWDEIIGGSGTIPFTASNFPLTGIGD